tara:strand:- start:1404 stop:1778 length:375 start_codon:yes stop_codon:yes gene_type:complete
LQDFLLVSFGAVLGANIRFIIYKRFEQINLSSSSSILIINTLASFFLGLFFSLLPNISDYKFSYQLVLFFSIGCLGSLSTFSTFAYDLFEAYVKLKFLKAFTLLMSSLSLGIIALAFGIFLGNQ